MSRRAWVGVVVIAMLLAVGLYFWWPHNPEQTLLILAQPVSRGRGSVYAVSFQLERPVKLKRLFVVPAKDGKPDPLETPIWELRAETASEPVQAFMYGQSIKGMKPLVTGSWPVPLEPRVVYCLVLETEDGRTGMVSFQALENARPTAGFSADRERRPRSAPTRPRG